MRAIAAAILAIAVGACANDKKAEVERCLPSLAEGRVQGLAIYVGAPVHGTSIMLLSETCKKMALHLELTQGDLGRIVALSRQQNPTALLLDGKASEIDYDKMHATLAPGATASIAPGLNGDQAWQRFRNEERLR